MGYNVKNEISLASTTSLCAWVFGVSSASKFPVPHPILILVFSVNLNWTHSFIWKWIYCHSKGAIHVLILTIGRGTKSVKRKRESYIYRFGGRGDLHFLFFMCVFILDYWVGNKRKNTHIFVFFFRKSRRPRRPRRRRRPSKTNYHQLTFYYQCQDRTNQG